MKMTRNPWFGGGENNSSSRTHFAPSHRAASRKSCADRFPVGAWTFCKCWSWHHVFTLVMMKWNEMKWNEHKPHQHWMRTNGGLQKWGYLQIIHFHRMFHHKPSILGFMSNSDLSSIHVSKPFQRLRLATQGIPNNGVDPCKAIYGQTYNMYIYIYI